MEGRESEDTAVQADNARRAESEVSGAAGHSHSHCAAMAVHGHCCQRGAEVRTACEASSACSTVMVNKC